MNGTCDCTAVLSVHELAVREHVEHVVREYSVDHLPSLACFIVQNLPNLDQVELTGLEMELTPRVCV